MSAAPADETSDRAASGGAEPEPFVPPMPPGHKRKLPLLRRFFRLSHSSLHAVYERSYDMQLGDVRGPRRDYFFVNEGGLVDRVLREVDRYPKSTLMAATLRQLLGESIFVTNGALWRRQRRMVGPAFELARIAEVFPAMVGAARDMLGRLRPLASGESVPIDLEMTHVTADVIFRTIYSRPMDRAAAEVIFEAFERYQELAWRHSVWMMAGVPERLSLPRLRARPHARRIRGLLEREVDRRLDEIAGGAPPPRDILQSMIDARDPETGDAFSRDELVDQVAITFLAGHETSASALGWTLYLLAHSPRHRARAEAEADAFWAHDEPEARNLRLLPHTRDCFREAMRLYPPVAFVPRDATEEEEMRGKRVRPGSVLFLSPYLLHRKRRVWPRPDAFDPDRFSDPAQREAVREGYMPFIKGPRVCLGASFALQEGVIVLSAILRHFRVEPDEAHTPKPISRLTLRSENGIRVRLTPRDEFATDAP